MKAVKEKKRRRKRRKRWQGEEGEGDGILDSYETLKEHHTHK